MPAGQPLEKARTQLACGATAAAPTREQLVEALDAFERLGAAPWADRTQIASLMASEMPEPA